MKQAQTVSTRDEFVPKDYMDFCKRMQDKVRVSGVCVRAIVSVILCLCM